MSPWDGILSEVHDQRTLIAAASLAVTAALVHAMAPEERGRLRALWAWLGLHGVIVPIAGWTRALELTWWRDVRFASLILLAMACVGMAGIVVFGVVLPRLRITVPRIVRDVAAAAAAGVVVLMLASHAGFNLSGLIATSAVLTAVIGFSLQDTLGNVMGGLAIQLDRSVQVGDWIKVGDVAGRVSEIRWRYVAIETRNWETVIIPNTAMTKSQITVVGRREGQPAQWRRWIWFNVDFRRSPSDVIAAVDEALQGRPIERVAHEPPPHCLLMELHGSYARFAVRYFLTDLAHDDATDSVVRTRLWFALARAGIPLSLPGHAVHVTDESGDREAARLASDQEKAAAALERVELFATLPAEDRVALAAGLRRAPFTRGEVITRQGAEAHWLYIIARGEVLVRVAVDGAEREVARLADGSFFGEMSLMTGEPRAATVVAVTDVDCLRLDKAVFQAIIRRRPELANHVAEVLARRRIELYAAREDLDQEAAARRLQTTRHDLVGRIRAFFGIGDDRARG